ncbi:low molecular weight protein arginine phosphatase [Texcoconibacillus texcoconensis]|uniref:Protein-tyrosine phosphatase n=1 Tax=Texcoconibacillus texcoconensis TaxID=1095777 RepID=A0A840QRI9_9BACI|nr:low molecular weight protein arginine phosphatase [Texcoconibacillus texcoconensis]MBB5174086.1 protein-tyrosine phosphatase [Texcoconibacillus texcoconensis]
MKNILFVCTGNTCRSPMAEAILKEKLSNDKMDIRSAGVHAMDGMPLSQGSKQVLETEGLSIDHESRALTETLLAWADLVLTMTESHKRMVKEQYPKNSDHVYTLKEYVNEDAHTKQKREELHQHLTEIELKRSEYLANNQKEVDEYNETNNVSDQEKMEMELLEQIKPHQEAIDRLKSELPSYDIVDPFGGNVDIYQKTYREMEKEIEKLISKLLEG